MSLWALPERDLLQLVNRRAASVSLEPGARPLGAESLRSAVGEVVACLEAVVRTADASARSGTA